MYSQAALYFPMLCNPLESKPKCYHDTYCSRKEIYGLNCQAISVRWPVNLCGCRLCHQLILQELYPIQGALNVCLTTSIFLQTKHINLSATLTITPYKKSVSRQRSQASFNYTHSTTIMNIHHALGVRKACCKVSTNRADQFELVKY